MLVKAANTKKKRNVIIDISVEKPFFFSFEDYFFSSIY